MAIQMSQRVMESYRFPHFPRLHLLIRSHRLRQAWRDAIAACMPATRPTSAAACSVTRSFDDCAADYRERGWAYFENVFEPEFHARLVREWPLACYFRPVANIYKSYDSGFHWRHTEPFSSAVRKNPVIEAAYSYLASPEFCGRVTAMCGDGVPRTLLTTLLTRAYAGSSVIPHRDTVALRPESRHHVNTIIFVAGTGGKQAGGLAIMNDPDYRDVVFEPTKLTNASLFYRIGDPFFHGFAPMRHGSFRWTINAQYAATEYAEARLRKRAGDVTPEFD